MSGRHCNADSDRLLPTDVRFSKLPKLDCYAQEDLMQMTEPWTSVDDIARHLGVAKDSIYRWIERRSLPAHRIGRLWEFKISEVDQGGPAKRRPFRNRERKAKSV